MLKKRSSSSSSSSSSSASSQSRDLNWATSKSIPLDEEPSDDAGSVSGQQAQPVLLKIGPNKEQVPEAQSNEESSSGAVDADREISENGAEEEDVLSGAGPSALPLEDYSDSSENELENRVGSVPMSWYAEHDHIGYNVAGERLERRSGRPDTLEQFLRSHERPWTVYDPVEDREVPLTVRDRQLLHNIARGRFPEPEFDPYEVFGDLGPPLATPVIELPEPKSQFVPSRWEKRRVHWLATLIKRGVLPPPAPNRTRRRVAQRDVWAGGELPSGPSYLPPPRLRLPGHAESYNAPAEYLLDPAQLAAWHAADAADRALPFVPRQYACLRHVPAYPGAVRERFERCLDIYLAPRKLQPRQWVDDPRQLLPQLPAPRDLRPFPTTEQLRYEGHTGRVLCLTLDPTGTWLASASADGSVLVWEIASTRLHRRFRFGAEDGGPACVAWCPAVRTNVLAVAVGSRVVLLCPETGGAAETARVRADVLRPRPDGPWRASDSPVRSLLVEHPRPVSQLVWHHKGDYFAALCPGSGQSQIRIHQLSKQFSQNPFSKGKSSVEAVQFHPSKPVLFVGTQRYLRVYDLQKQTLQKKLQLGAKHATCLAVHPTGNHVLVGSFDRRTCWLDLDLAQRPFKILRYHRAAIRAIQFHAALPLLASASDDGTVHVFHARVYADLVTDPLVVPVKVLRGHDIVDEVGVLDVKFHPQQPWLFSAGADGTVRLFI